MFRNISGQPLEDKTERLAICLLPAMRCIGISLLLVIASLYGVGGSIMSPQEIATSTPLDDSIRQPGSAQAQPSNAFKESYQLGQFPGKGNKAQWEQAYSYIQKTKNLKNAGHYDEAIEASQKAIEIYPSYN